MRPPSDVLRALLHAGTELDSTTSLEATLKLIVEAARRLTSAWYAAIGLFGPDGSLTQFASTEGTEPAAADSAPCPTAVLEFLLRQRATVVSLPGDPVDSAMPAVESLARYGFLGMPLRLQDEALGALYVLGAPAAGPFTHGDHLLLRILGQQAALAIGNACLRWHAEERTEKLTALSKLTRFISSAPSSHEVSDAVAKAATILLGGTIACVWLSDATGVLTAAGRFTLDPAFEHVMSHFRSPRAAAARVFATRRPEYVLDTQEDPRWLGEESTKQAGLHASAGIPMVTRDRVVGVLSILFAERRDFTREDRELMGLLADQAAIALYTAQLFEETERRRLEAEVLSEIARTINASLNLDTILQRLAAAARDLCRSDLARIAFWEPHSGAVVFWYCVGTRYRHYDTLRLQPGKGLSAHVFATGHAARSDDLSADPRTQDYLWLIRAEGAVTAMVVPIRVCTAVEGLIYVENRWPRPFTDRDEAILSRLADHAAIAIRNAQLLVDAERRRKAAETLATLGRLISRRQPLSDLVPRIVEELTALLKARSSQLVLVERADGDAVTLARSGEIPGAEHEVVRHLVLCDGRPVVTRDAAVDDRLRLSPEMRTRLDRVQNRAVLAVPLLVAGRVAGVLTVSDQTGRAFNEDDIGFAQDFADQVALARESPQQ